MTHAASLAPDRPKKRQFRVIVWLIAGLSFP